ncbi:hypothetical protein B0H34DRAFT_149982 [Crassisporium funariophilum]|nr:hypothetical protein B0H34DRAFT_149982 [Crassisporium funariophilum]
MKSRMFGFALGQLAILLFISVVLKYSVFQTGFKISLVAFRAEQALNQSAPQVYDGSRCDQEGGLPSEEWLNSLLSTFVKGCRRQLRGGKGPFWAMLSFADWPNPVNRVLREDQRQKLQYYANLNRPSDLDHITIDWVTLGSSAPTVSNIRYNSVERKIDMDVTYVDNVRISFETSKEVFIFDIDLEADVELTQFRGSLSLELPSPGSDHPKIVLRVSPHFVLDLKTSTDAAGGLATFSGKLNRLIRRKLSSTLENWQLEVPLPEMIVGI